MPSAIETLFGTGFASILGSPVAWGLIGLLFLMVLGVVFRLSIEGFLVFLLPAIFIFAIAGYLPLSILYAVIIGCAFIIFLAFMTVLKR